MIMWNHTVRVHKDVEGTDDFGTTQNWVAGDEPTGHNARPDQNWSGDQQNAGGEMQGAKRRWFLKKTLDVAERDVIEVTAGPEAPALLRVVSVFPAGGRITHHLEANVETFTGTLPTVENES